MKIPMSCLFQYKIKTFWKQQTANKTANSKQQTVTACIFALYFIGSKLVVHQSKLIMLV